MQIGGARGFPCGAKGGHLLIHVIRTDNHYDYVKDFMLDLLIASKEIVQFHRSSGWVNIATDPIRKEKRSPAKGGNS